MEIIILVYNEDDDIFSDDPYLGGLEFKFPYPMSDEAVSLIETMVGLKKKVVILPNEEKSTYVRS